LREEKFNCAVKSFSFENLLDGRSVKPDNLSADSDFFFLQIFAKRNELLENPDA